MSRSKRRLLRVSNVSLPIYTVYNHEWDTISLPDNLCSVDPVHTTSKIIQGFLRKMEAKHDDFIIRLGSALNEINKNVEYTIRMKSKALKKEVEHFIMSGHNFIRIHLEAFETDCLMFDDYKFEQCKKYCSSLLIQGKSKIYDFYIFLKSVEKYRSEKFQNILMNSYNDLLRINTKSPYEVQLFFEEHILAYNQIVLSNLRNYKEIEAHLFLVYTNEIKLMLYKIVKFEECWKDLCKEEIINRLKEYNIKKEEVENVLFKNDSITRIVKLFNTKIESILEQMLTDGNGSANEWLENTKNALTDLDTTAKQLISLYKTTADILYSKYYIESETILEQMVNKRFTNIDEMKLSLNLTNKTKYFKDINETDLQELWKKTVEFVLEALYAKFTFLEELEKIFLMHRTRISTAQEIVVENFKKLILQHDKILQHRNEASLNIILDSLRRDSTKASLDNTLKRAENVIYKIKHTMEKQKEEQLATIKTIYEYSDDELLILKTELKLFVQEYSVEHVVDAKRELNRKNYTSLFKILKETRDYFKELCLWKHKIMENVETLIVTCKQEQHNKAEQWVTEQEKYVMINFESKLEFYKSRLDRIKEDIYSVRLCEIKIHDSRFTSHSTEIQSCLDKLAAEESNFENENNAFLSKLSGSIDNPEIDMIQDLKELEITLLNLQMAIQKESSHFQDIITNQTENINSKIDSLYSQNLLFLKSMKLFHEKGNFSTAEVRNFTKKIRQLNNNIKKKAIALHSNLHNFKFKIEPEFQELRLKVEEKQKNARLLIEFKTDVKNHYNSVQTALKSIVIETKTVKNKTHMINERLTKLLQLRSNPYAYLIYVIGDCKELSKRFSIHKEYLEDLEDAPKLKPLPAKTTSSVSTKKSTLSISRSVMVVKHDLPKLFDNEKDLQNVENKFLSKIRKILIVNVYDLEKKAKKFYSIAKKEDCLKYNILSSIRLFIGGVLHKFTYYYLQCLQIWIIEIRDFINMVHNLQITLGEFCEKYVKQVHENQVDQLEKQCNAHMSEIKQSMNSAFTNIKSTSDLLKPLYGYPGNHQMLTNLNEKMNKTIENSKKHFLASIAEPKNYIENVLNNYAEDLTKTVNDIQELFDLIPEKSDYENLVAQVKNIMFTTNFDNLLMPIHCTEIIDSSEVDIGNINEIMLQAEPGRIKPDELKDLLLQNFAEILGEKVEKMYEIECDFLNMIPRMKTLWNENVEKVIDLYKIKTN